MDRRSFIKTGMAATFGAAAAGMGIPSCSSETSPPNIIYIMSDQHRADAMGCAGHPSAVTPNLDALAARGVRFGRCYCNAPLCRPSRASMMTGLHPRQHRVWTNWRAPDQYGPSHVRRLRDEAGYRTAIIGKTHLHMGEGHLDDYHPILGNWGFDHVQEVLGPGQSASIKGPYTDWLEETTGENETSKYERLKHYVKTQHELNWLSPWFTLPPDIPPWNLSTDDHADTFTGATAASFIGNYAEDKPLYLQVSFPGPHNPFDSTCEFRSLLPPDESIFPDGILKSIPEPWSYLVEHSISFQNITAMSLAQHNLLQSIYLAKASLVDNAVGMVLDAVESNDRLRNTWIIYGSDHGEMLGDHLLIGKVVFYEGATRVPLIIRPPDGAPNPFTSSGLVDQLDVTATIEDIAGLPAESSHGESLLDTVLDEDTTHGGKDWVLSENFLHGMMVADGVKLVMDYRTMDPVELYDLGEDPKELDNRIADPDYQEVVSTMSEQIADCAPFETQENT